MKSLIQSRIESLPVFRWEESGESVVIYQLPDGNVEIDAALEGRDLYRHDREIILANCLKSLFKEATK